MDADEMMSLVAEQTHYFPESWRQHCASFAVRDEFLSIFKYKGQLFLEEVLVVLLAPYVLMVAMPREAHEIIKFIKEHTTEVDGIGAVCGYSLFDFDRYGDERYGAPTVPSDATIADLEAQGESGGRRRLERTEQGKMEKSFLNFKLHHPDWQPGPSGDKFLENLCTFQETEMATEREEQLRGQAREVLQGLGLGEQLDAALQASAVQALGANLAKSADEPPAGQSPPSFDPIQEDSAQEEEPRPVDPKAGGGQGDSSGPQGGIASPNRRVGLGASLLGSTMDQSGSLTLGDLCGGDLALSSVLASLAHAAPGHTTALGAQSLLSRSSMARSNLQLGRSALGRSALGRSASAGRGSMLAGGRTVESILESALREDAQAASLRETLDRTQRRQHGFHGVSPPGGGVSSSHLLDAGVEASFYWLDRYRAEKVPPAATPAAATTSPGAHLGSEPPRNLQLPSLDFAHPESDSEALARVEAREKAESPPEAKPESPAPHPLVPFPEVPRSSSAGDGSPEGPEASV
mmetsp:Transcript_12035/g.28193  ORF Transcript_12035/g.28193 Transcript_12035/m.28193 type:complete len:521 (+) Transcript_12035:170-1732(+)